MKEIIKGLVVCHDFHKFGCVCTKDQYVVIDLVAPYISNVIECVEENLSIHWG